MRQRLVQFDKPLPQTKNSNKKKFYLREPQLENYCSIPGKNESINFGLHT